MRLLCWSLAFFAGQVQAQFDFRAAFGDPYIHGALASFSTERNSGLDHASGRYAWAVAIGGRRSPHWAWEVEYLEIEQRADTPPGLRGSSPFVGTAPQADISSAGVAGNVRFIYPLGSFAPYAGAGIGYFRTELTSLQTVAFFPFPSEVKRSDSGIGTQLLVGVQYQSAARTLWGFQYRRLDLAAKFGPDVPGTVKVGGTLRLFHLGRAF
jgi:opacity protein-like surface antigen